MGRASCHYANLIGEFVSPPAAIITPPWTPPFFSDKLPLLTRPSKKGCLMIQAMCPYPKLLVRHVEATQLDHKNGGSH